MNLSEKIEEIKTEERKAKKNAIKALVLIGISGIATLYYSHLEKSVINELTTLGFIFFSVREFELYLNFRRYCADLRRMYPAYFNSKDQNPN